jgi:hypothetical protein
MAFSSPTRRRQDYDRAIDEIHKVAARRRDHIQPRPAHRRGQPASGHRFAGTSTAGALTVARRSSIRQPTPATGDEAGVASNVDYAGLRRAASCPGRLVGGR